MKILKQIAIITSFTLAGEILNKVIPFPIPAGVYGLFLLVIFLCTGIIKESDISMTANYLLDIMPILFVPATVGIIETFVNIREIIIPVFIMMIVSTVMVMTVTGKMSDIVTGMRKEENLNDGNNR